MSKGHCTGYMACGGIHKPPYCQQWRWCTAWTTPPSSFARTHSSSPCKKSAMHPPCFPWFPTYVAGRGILLSSGIESMEVYVEPEPPILLPHQHLEGWMAPPSNISWMCWQTSSPRGGVMHLNHSLNSSSSRSLMMCSVISVHPISLGSKENTWWNSRSRCMAFWASSVANPWGDPAHHPSWGLWEGSPVSPWYPILVLPGLQGSLCPSSGEHSASGRVVRFQRTTVTLQLLSFSCMTYSPLGSSA